MMNFSAALAALKTNQKVFRRGWNSKDMYLQLVHGQTMTMTATPVTLLPHILMTTVQGDLVPWVASHTDLLSDDWEVIPSGKIIEPSADAAQQLDPSLNPRKKH